MPFLTMIIVIIVFLIFFGLCVMSDQLKDIDNELVEIARLLKRSEQDDQ